MKNLKKFYYPQTVEGALNILGNESEKKKIIAGGTSVNLSHDDTVEALVDITRTGLDYIKKSDETVTIGATTTIQKIFKSDICRKLGNGLLCEAASLVWSRGIRNMVTLGGNIVGLRIWSDMPTALLALDASVKIRGKEERIVKAHDFFESHPQKILAPTEMVTEIIFPLCEENSGGRFIKFAKTLGDYSIITVACYMEMKEDICKKIRIAIGSVTNLPKRIPEAENILLNENITDEKFSLAGQKCREAINPISNVWGSAGYKSALVENLVNQALRDAYEQIDKK